LVVLDGEDESDLRDRLQNWPVNLGARSGPEFALSERVVRSSWSLKRAEKAQEATLRKNQRKVRDEYEDRTALAVRDAANRLEADPLGAVIELKRTCQGLQHLYTEFDLISERLKGGDPLAPLQRLRLLYLVGRRAEEIPYDVTASRWFIAGAACASADLAAMDGEAACRLLGVPLYGGPEDVHRKQAALEDVRSLPDMEVGRAELLAMIAKEMADLEALEAKVERTERWDLERDVEAAGADNSIEGSRAVSYIERHDRMMKSGLRSLWKMKDERRADEAAGVELDFVPDPPPTPPSPDLGPTDETEPGPIAPPADLSPKDTDVVPEAVPADSLPCQAAPALSISSEEAAPASGSSDCADKPAPVGAAAAGESAQTVWTDEATCQNGSREAVESETLPPTEADLPARDEAEIEIEIEDEVESAPIPPVLSMVVAEPASSDPEVAASGSSDCADEPAPMAAASAGESAQTVWTDEATWPNGRRAAIESETLPTAEADLPAKEESEIEIEAAPIPQVIPMVGVETETETPARAAAGEEDPERRRAKAAADAARGQEMLALALISLRRRQWERENSHAYYPDEMEDWPRPPSHGGPPPSSSAPGFGRDPP
jgi:hypothetical protein